MVRPRRLQAHRFMSSQTNMGTEDSTQHHPQNASQDSWSSWFMKALTYDTNISFGSPDSDWTAISAKAEHPVDRQRYENFKHDHITFASALSDVMGASTRSGAPNSAISLNTTAEDSFEFTPSFEMMDANHDGVLTREELMNGVHKYGLNLTPWQASELFDSLDANGDQVLSRQEFYQHAWDAHVQVAVTHSCFETGMPMWHEGVVPSNRSKEFQAAVVSLLNAQGRARVITSASPPFNIEAVNDPWVTLCGFTAEEAYGQSLSILQGPDTEKEVLSKFMHEVSQGKRTEAVLTNYTKGGTAFKNQLVIEPIRNDDGHISHFLTTIEDVSVSAYQ